VSGLAGPREATKAVAPEAATEPHPAKRASAPMVCVTRLRFRWPARSPLALGPVSYVSSCPPGCSILRADAGICPRDPSPCSGRALDLSIVANTWSGGTRGSVDGRRPVLAIALRVRSTQRVTQLTPPRSAFGAIATSARRRARLGASTPRAYARLRAHDHPSVEIHGDGELARFGRRDAKVLQGRYVRAVDPIVSSIVRSGGSGPDANGHRGGR
jgi:hypothetical protein